MGLLYHYKSLNRPTFYVLSAGHNNNEDPRTCEVGVTVTFRTHIPILQRRIAFISWSWKVHVSSKRRYKTTWFHVLLPHLKTRTTSSTETSARIKQNERRISDCKLDIYVPWCKLAASALFTNKVWNGGGSDCFSVLPHISLDRLNITANSLGGFCDSNAGCSELESDKEVISGDNPLHCTSLSQYTRRFVGRNRCERCIYSDTSANEFTNFSANEEIVRCFLDSANEHGFG